MTHTYRGQPWRVQGRTGVCLTRLEIFAEGYEVFLELSSGVIDVLLGPIEHEYFIDVTVSSGWGAICVLLAKVLSFKKGPAVCPRNYFLFMALGFISDGIVCERYGGGSVDSLDVWDPYIVPGISQAVFL